MGSAAVISVFFTVRNHGYWLAFLVPTMSSLSPIILLVAKKYYIETPPYGFVILEVPHPLVFGSFYPVAYRLFLL